MHITILRRRQSPVIEKCIKCCSSKYHCPFCKPQVYRPAMELHQVQYHVHNHLSLAVKHQEFYIVKCNLYCRDQAHFHCCYCPTTIIRRVQIVKHLTACRKRCLITKPSIKIEPDAITDPTIKREPDTIQICPESHFPEPAVKTEPDKSQVFPESHFPKPAVKTEPDAATNQPPAFLSARMHITILRRGQSPVIEKCIKCCSNKYHCPFCKPQVYRPAMELHQVQYHVHNHLSLAVKHEEFYIVKCNLYCRDQAHFHCCYCPTTIIRRIQIVKHLTACRKRCLITKPSIKIEPDAITDPTIKTEPDTIQICPESHFPEPAVKTEPDKSQVFPESHFPEPAVKTEPDTIQICPESHFPEPAVKTEPDKSQVFPESHFPEPATLTKTVIETEPDAATNQPPALLSAHVYSVYYILMYPG